MHTQAPLALLALATIVLSGCSGAGSTVPEVQGGVPAAASRVLSAFALVKSWTEMMYPEASEYRTYHSEHVAIGGRAATREWGVLSDGGRYVYVVFDDDGVFRGTIRWGDTWVQTWCSKPEFSEDGTYTRAGELTWSSGARLHWSQVANSTKPTFPQVITGTAVTPDKQRMTYEWHREQDAADEVSASLPDGSALHLQCPTHFVGAQHRPLYGPGLTGTYQSGAASVALKLSGTGAGWDSWATTETGGLAGSFALDSSMAASGALRTAAGETAGLLRWTTTEVATLDLLGAGEVAVTPSAAALKCQITSWVGNAALLGPSPLY